METENIKLQLQAIVEDLGYEYVGIEFVREEGTLVLRLYVDGENGIMVHDCEKISHAADEYLDKIEAFFKDNYLLEVSSPGLERPLFKPQDYARFAGNPISIKLKQTCNGRRRISANIVGEKDSLIILECDGKRIEVPFEDIATAHLIYVEKKGQKKVFKKRGGKK